MKRSFPHYTFVSGLIFLFFFNQHGFAIDTLQKPFRSYREKIEILAKGFDKEIVICGKTSAPNGQVKFFIPQDSEIKNYKIYEQKEKRKKELKDIPLHIENVSGDEFYSESFKSIILDLPEDISFEIHCCTHCSEILLLNLLSFRSLETDTVVYDISVPYTFSLFYRMTDLSLLDSVQIDSSETAQARVYRFMALNGKLFFGYGYKPSLSFCSKRDHFSGFQLIIVPAAFKHHPEQYLCEWYANNLKSMAVPDNEMLDVVNAITGKIKDPDSVISVLYAYARDKIRYLGIYKGMETIIPKNVNDILEKKFGDCKDKSNFLCQSLIYKGFDARLAICSTRDHPFDMDFPSLSGGNHMVCFLKNPHGTDWYILDATNPSGTVTSPGYYLENRSFLIIGKTALSYKLKSIQKNDVNIRMELKEQNDVFTGICSITFRGYSDDILRSVIGNSGSKESKKELLEFLAEISPTCRFSDIIITDDQDSVKLTCPVSIAPSAITKVDNRYYIKMNFVPRLHTSYPDPGFYDLLLDYQVSDHAVVNISFSKPVSLIKNKDLFRDNDPTFSFRATAGGNNLSCSYDLRISNTEIPAHSQKQFLNDIQKINTCLDGVLVVETH